MGFKSYSDTFKGWHIDEDALMSFYWRNGIENPEFEGEVCTCIESRKQSLENKKRLLEDDTGRSRMLTYHIEHQREQCLTCGLYQQFLNEDEYCCFYCNNLSHPLDVDEIEKHKLFKNNENLITIETELLLNGGGAVDLIEYYIRLKSKDTKKLSEYTKTDEFKKIQRQLAKAGLIEKSDMPRRHVTNSYW